MTTLDAYATLAEYKAYALARGGTASTSTTDDAIIEDLLRAQSRFIDRRTLRRFYPSVETHYLDVPLASAIDPRELPLDDDFLEVLSVVNGDGITIPSTEYVTLPRGKYPSISIRLKDSSTYAWYADSSGDVHGVIQVTGIVGYHNRYGIAWLSGSTLSANIDASVTSIAVASGTLFSIGQLIRMDNELGYLSNVSSNTLTSTRGENTSTAAAHLSAVIVKIWQVMEDIKEFCLLLSHEAYQNRHNQGAQVTQITGAGVVIKPAGIPARVYEGLDGLRRLT